MKNLNELVVGTSTLGALLIPIAPLIPDISMLMDEMGIVINIDEKIKVKQQRNCYRIDRAENTDYIPLEKVEKFFSDYYGINKIFFIREYENKPCIAVVPNKE